MNELFNYTDLASLAVSAVLIALYHAYLALRLKKDPSYTIQAVNRAARTQWVVSMMGDPGRNIVGVQTLRNATMAATFMASTAVLLIVGTLNLSGEANKLIDTWHVLNIGSTHPALWILKLLFLVSDFFVAFFAFTMSVRLYNHVGFQISVPREVRAGILSTREVAIHLNRAGYYYSIGMRAYYFSVPLVFWLFGPLFMFLATLVLIAVMYHVDRTPQDPGGYEEQVSVPHDPAAAAEKE